MFDRFTDRARKVMGYARQASDRLKHDHIGTEHLLLGLLRESDCEATEVLRKLGVEPDAVRREVRELLGAEPPVVKFTVPTSGKLSLDLMAQHVGSWHTQAAAAGDPLLAARLRYLLDYLNERMARGEGGSSQEGSG